MATQAKIIVKPTLGKRLYQEVGALRDEHFEKTHHHLSDAAIARRVGLIPETFRRLIAGKGDRITLTTAIMLIQLFKDPEIADYFEFEDDPENPDAPVMDADALDVLCLKYANSDVAPTRNLNSLYS